MRKAMAFYLFGLLALGFLPALSAEQVDETKAEVPELSAFHDVIYPIWHTAYPDKDYAALRSFAPEVKDKAQGILSAKLPGILRDKQEKWDAGLAEFKKAVENYSASSDSGTDEDIWKAAEVLHDSYEKLVCIIRPPPDDRDE